MNTAEVQERVTCHSDTQRASPRAALIRMVHVMSPLRRSPGVASPALGSISLLASNIESRRGRPFRKATDGDHSDVLDQRSRAIANLGHQSAYACSDGASMQESIGPQDRVAYPCGLELVFTLRCQPGTISRSLPLPALNSAPVA